MKKSFGKGFLTIEITIVLIISVIVGLFLLQQQARSAKTSLANVQADQLIQLRDAINSYSDIYRIQIAGNQPIVIDTDGDGISDSEIPSAGNPEGTIINPTPQQLVGLALLPPQFNTVAVANSGRYKIRLQVLPLGCSVANPASCRIEGYVFLDQPITEPGDDIAAGEYDGQVVGDILNRMGGDGFASVVAGQNLVAAGGNFQIALDSDDLTIYPGTSVPAGLVGMRVGSFATRPTVDPVANVDFCPGDTTQVWWPSGETGSTPQPYTVPVSGGTNGKPSAGGKTPTEQNGCVASVIDDIPAGYTFLAVDFNQPVIGVAQVRCQRQADGTVQLQYTPTGTCNDNSPK